MFFIHQSIKNSNYSEDSKRNKKNNIRKSSQEIHDKVAAFDKIEFLSPVVRTNLQICKDYIIKIRGAN
jgi:hypothetical protein